jgi:DNA-binding transcriptional MerR regulator
MSKGPNAFRTISEAADELGLPQHVLRFWETKFSFIRPMKRAGGRRFYRPQDIEVLHHVRTLLREQGLSIRAVQQMHKSQGLKGVLDPQEDMPQDLGLDARTPVATDRSVFSSLPMRLTDGERQRLLVILNDLSQAKTALDLLLQGRKG